MRWTRAGARVPLMLAVLAGLFLMHGLSAAASAGCPGAAMAAAPVRASWVMAAPAPSALPAAQDTHPMTAPESAQGADLATPAQNSASHAGETCVPLRPKGFAGFALVLFALSLGRGAAASSRNAVRDRPHWPHGPPRARGRDLLTGLGVSRT